MKVPNYKVASIVAVIVVAISLKLYAASPKFPAPQVWSPGCVASVPKSWGAFRGASTESGFAFEDGSGTLLFVTNVPCDGTPVVGPVGSKLAAIVAATTLQRGRQILIPTGSPRWSNVVSCPISVKHHVMKHQS